MKITADWLETTATKYVTEILEKEGHKALFVGGCVRNMILDEPVSDLDISTDAHPQTVMKLAAQAGLKAVPTGIDHGTVTVVADGHPYEVTTFRRDVETDGRRAVVAFTDKIEEDARRRDFTMNAIYCDARGQVIDPLGGLPDLHARHVRFIDDPHDRIREDYLRILRFFRFHAWYGRGGIDADGLAACAELAEGISALARERVGQEMRKLLAAPDPAPATATMQMAGILARVLPGADTAALAPLIHLEQETDTPPDAIRRLAAIGGEAPRDALRLSNEDARRLDLLRTTLGSPAQAAELGYRHGAHVARDVVLLRTATMAQPINPDDLHAADHGAAQVFPITARDLMPNYQGPALGARLKQLETHWIAGGFQPTRDDLLRFP